MPGERDGVYRGDGYSKSGNRYHCKAHPVGCPVRPDGGSGAAAVAGEGTARPHRLRGTHRESLPLHGAIAAWPGRFQRAKAEAERITGDALRPACAGGGGFGHARELDSQRGDCGPVGPGAEVPDTRRELVQATGWLPGLLPSEPEEADHFLPGRSGKGGVSRKADAHAGGSGRGVPDAAGWTRRKQVYLGPERRQALGESAGL